MTGYDGIGALVDDIDPCNITRMEGSVSQVDRGHLTRRPCRPAAPESPDPLDAEVDCADKVVAVQGADDTAEWLAVPVDRRFEVRVVVADRARMPDDHPTIVVHMGGVIVDMDDTGDHEDCRYGCDLPLRQGEEAKAEEEDEHDKDDRYGNQQDRGDGV